MISFAYDVQNRQIAGAAWMGAEERDIEAKLDIPGDAKSESAKGHGQLLADRFALKCSRSEAGDGGEGR